MTSSRQLLSIPYIKKVFIMFLFYIKLPSFLQGMCRCKQWPHGKRLLAARTKPDQNILMSIRSKKNLNCFIRKGPILLYIKEQFLTASYQS